MVQKENSELKQGDMMSDCKTTIGLSDMERKEITQENVGNLYESAIQAIR